MPLYWRRRRPRFYRQYWRKRYRPFRSRRPRTTIFRRFRRRRWVRRHFFTKRKLKKLKLKQWQPRHIVRCKIVGDIPLFICGKTRITHNYTLYKESNSSVGESTGGGWSVQLFTLKCLYDEYIKYKNFWTRSNQGLPLARFLGGRLRFYKSPFTDYIVTIKTCPPFTITKDMFLNSHPQRQLMEPRKILIPQLHSGTRRKYKTIKLNPPSLLQNKWYFQQDLCQTPLVMISTTACSFEQPYAPENHVSDSITLYSLETNTFQNSDFYTLRDNEGYIPKHLGTQKMHLYGRKKHGHDPPKTWEDVIILGNTRQYTSGKETTTIQEMKNSGNWGNPFSAPWNHEEEQIYYSEKWPQSTDTMSTTVTFTKLEHIYIQCRYNPQKDKGTGNKLYLKKNDYDHEEPIGTLPTNERLILKDYPLWLAWWGWVDWLKRVPEAQQINSNYYVVVVSPYIYPPRPYYVFLDKYFVETTGENLTLTDYAKWHPKYEMQTEVEFYFGQSGPFTPKINRSELIQADMNYKFYFKWGGCPAPMENIVSPCDQEKYPVPNNQQQGFEIQDPSTEKEYFLYEWDQRRDQITKTCAKRIKKDSKSDFSITELPAFDVPIQTSQAESEKEETSEEEDSPLQQQLYQLRQQQKLLRKQLLRLSKQQNLE
nr:MAG: ORF1 [TTV-like mini virus]